MTQTPRDILNALVSFPTVSRDTNVPLIDWVETYLTDLGVRAHRMPKADDPTKHAIFCSVGPEVEGGIVLSGHTDVVPVDGQNWSSDPWTVVEKDGKLYGRGTCDMKGFDALALHALQYALLSDLKRPLQIALSFDEEIGCTGAPPLINAMADAGLPKAQAAIIGEPSMMACVTGHKGSDGFNLHFKGFEVHSSLMHTGVNAIMEGAKLIDWANQVNAGNAAAAPSAVAKIFNPPWTTLIIVTPMFGVPPLRPEQDGAAEHLVRRITGDNATHVVSYGTEAGHFQAAGYSAVVCGPGDISQAHQADEYLSVAQFEAGEAFLRRVIDSLCD